MSVAPPTTIDGSKGTRRPSSRDVVPDLEDPRPPIPVIGSESLPECSPLDRYAMTVHLTSGRTARIEHEPLVILQAHVDLTHALAAGARVVVLCGAQSFSGGIRYVQVVLNCDHVIGAEVTMPFDHPRQPPQGDSP